MPAPCVTVRVERIAGYGYAVSCRVCGWRQEVLRYPTAEGVARAHVAHHEPTLVEVAPAGQLF